jgi:hypothetical protein
MSSVDFESLLSSNRYLRKELMWSLEYLMGADDHVVLEVWALSPKARLRRERLEKCFRLLEESGILRRGVLWRCPQCGDTADAAETTCSDCRTERPENAIEKVIYRLADEWKQGVLQQRARMYLPRPLRVFCSHSPEDRRYREELESHLVMLREQGLITELQSGQVMPGRGREESVKEHREAADLILLLISSDFLNSESCYSLEMPRAMERHRQRAARVIPIHVRRCDWQGTPFAELQGLLHERPIAEWRSRDEAWTQVAAGLRQVVLSLRGSVVSPRAAPCPV